MVKDVEGSGNRPSLGTVRILPGVTEENNVWGIKDGGPSERHLELRISET